MYVMVPSLSMQWVLGASNQKGRETTNRSLAVLYMNSILADLLYVMYCNCLHQMGCSRIKCMYVAISQHMVCAAGSGLGFARIAESSWEAGQRRSSWSTLPRDKINVLPSGASVKRRLPQIEQRTCRNRMHSHTPIFAFVNQCHNITSRCILVLSVIVSGTFWSICAACGFGWQGIGSRKLWQSRGTSHRNHH